MINTTSNRLLIVDDEAGIRSLLGTVAEQLGFEVHTVGKAEEFSATVEEVIPTAMILDLNMPKNDGDGLLRRLAEIKSEAQVLVFSGQDSCVINAALRSGSELGLNMAGSLQKPVSLSTLKAALDHMMRKATTDRKATLVNKEQSLCRPPARLIPADHLQRT